MEGAVVATRGGQEKLVASRRASIRLRLEKALRGDEFAEKQKARRLEKENNKQLLDRSFSDLLLASSQLRTASHLLLLFSC